MHACVCVWAEAALWAPGGRRGTRRWWSAKWRCTREQEMIDFVRGGEFSLEGLRHRFRMADGAVE